MKAVKNVIESIMSKLWFDNAGSTDTPNGRIPFEYISDRLRMVVGESKDIIGKQIIVPNRYVLHFSPEDRAYRKHIESIMKEELTIVLEAEVEKIKGICPDRTLDVEIRTDVAMQPGEFYIESMIDDGEIKPMKDAVPEILKSKKNRNLSGISIPPPGSIELLDGTFIKTLLSSEVDVVGRPVVDEYTWKISLVDKGKDFFAPDGTIYIGRSTNAHIKLNEENKMVSRLHVQLNISDEGMSMKMIGLNGGHLNEARMDVGQECFLSPGDILRIGPERISFSCDKKES